MRSAPGARIIKSGGSKTLENENPSAVPFPKDSRIADITISANVKPIPIPKASIIERIGGSLDENASARPKTIQFTTINGTNIPKDLIKRASRPS